MGINPVNLYNDYNLRLISNAIQGYFENQNNIEKANWERSRWQVFHLINIQLERKHKMKTFKDLAVFPWEEEPKKPEPIRLTPKQFEAIINNQ